MRERPLGADLSQILVRRSKNIIEYSSIIRYERYMINPIALDRHVKQCVAIAGDSLPKQ